MAQLLGRDVRVRLSEGVAGPEMKRQGGDQFGVGQLTHLASMDPWGAACPVQLLSGWLRFARAAERTPLLGGTNVGR